MELNKKDIERVAEELLIESGYYAKRRTEADPSYINKKIKYNMPIGQALVDFIKEHKADLWGKWISQTKDYLKKDRHRHFRPTIDRVDSNGDYCSENINFLPFLEHIQKDKAISVIVYDSEKRSLREYPSMASVGAVLGCSRETISRYCNSGVKYLNRYVIQSEGDKQSKRSKRIERIQTYNVVANVVLNEYDEAGMIIREIPAQIHTTVEFPKIELRRKGK